MGSSRFGAMAAAACALIASTAAAQSADKLTPTQIALACAPPPVVATRPDMAPFVNGSQDPVARRVFGTPELLTLTGGTDRGLQLGQQYIVRRIFTTAENHLDRLPHQEQTVGWVRIVAVNATTAVASVDHACGDILLGDFIEPFELPTLSEAEVTAVDTTREPDFSAMARILYGAEQRRSGGVGEFMLIDQGVDKSVAVGQHFAIYRNLKSEGTPLSAIGEATVVATGPKLALVRINRARDAVFSGDFAVPRSK
jgi:hypothetical protein